ncbi:MAG TPA: hypothetical protein ENI92_04870 [Bacteroidetes bacterium]|nr:hypothetical protein [Bacteroidota bacterium]
MRPRLPLLALLLLLSSLPAHAEFDWGARYAGDFLTGQSSARLLALGGAGVAIANGPAAVLANPALLAPSRRQALSLMHADRFTGAVKVDHAAYVRRARQEGGALGVGLVRQGVDDIPITRLRDPSRPIGPDNRVISEESGSASEYALFFAYAMEKPYGRIGASAKLIGKRLYTSNALGLGFDIGYARSFGRLTLAGQLRDALTTVLAWNTGRQEGIAPTARLGAALDLPLERLKARVVPVVEMEIRLESAGNEEFTALHAGLEYTIQDRVSVRIGTDDGRMTYGAGLALGDLALHYAFVGHDDLGETHRISLAYRWGR